MKNQNVNSCPGYWAVTAIALVTAVITSAAVTFIYHSRLAQQIKVVDLKGYMMNQKVLLSTGEIDEAQWLNNLNAFEERLQNEPANHVVLLKEVVLRNGEELHVQ